MAGPDWEEADPVAGDGGDGDAPAIPDGDAAHLPMDDAAPVWTDDDIVSPSVTTGEGARGDAFPPTTEDPLAQLADAGWNDLSDPAADDMHPHPNPLPAYREREPEVPVLDDPPAPAPTGVIESVFARLLADPYSFDFYQAVRRIEAERPELPPVGHSLRPSQDAVRFSQEPSLAFAPSTVWDYWPAEDNAPARLFVNFLGLLGPNGPLPSHLTDYARDRERNHGDSSMARFLDLFNHRMLALFYRAWASSSQAVSFERGTRAHPTDAAAADRFGTYFASLFGMGMASLRDRDAVRDTAKLHFTGRLANETRNAEGLRSIVQSFFGIEADIEEFIGRWIDIPEPYRCRLGESRETCVLGQTAIVGSKSWDCQQKFRIRLGPMGLQDYQRMLPGGDSIKRLVTWVKTYTCDEFDWDVRLVLRSREIPQVRLGGMGQLGWTTWLNSVPAVKDAEDLILHPAA
jgi:type VI secretion system protein ImpH